MKKFVKNILLDILLIILIFTLLVVLLIYIPKDIKILKEEISESTPEEYSSMSEERNSLFNKFDSFILDSATDGSKSILNLIFSKQYKLNWYIQKDILEEINDEISDEELKIWYVYNMGIVAETGDQVICFDISTVIASPILLNLSEKCNYLILSHGDGDHFSPMIVRRVLNTGGKVVIQDDSGIWESTIKALVSDDVYENIYNLENEEGTIVDSLSLYPLKTKHRGEEKENTWFSVKVNGFNIVHTGDGTLNSYEEWDKLGDIDVLLANTIIQPIDLEDSNARYMIPLHMHEISHNREFLEENSFAGYFEKLRSYNSDISSKIYPLLWGESISIFPWQ